MEAKTSKEYTSKEIQVLKDLGKVRLDYGIQHDVIKELQLARNALNVRPHIQKFMKYKTGEKNG